MRITELRAILEKLRMIYVAGMARKQADDIGEIINLLKGHDEKSVAEFVREAKTLIAQVRPRAGTEIDSAAVKRYAEMLLDAGTDEALFKAAFSALKSDRIRKPTLEAIANRYINEPSGGTYVFKFNSKPKALERIRIKFIERAELESKGRIIAGANRRA
jgi:hypothetical protein